ncbi:proline-rich protein [Amanita rubescens]|nr:proline-rich protein [Amanita rubescens]
MPSFAELKAKAAKAKDAGVEKMHNVKDRNTSVPMKKTNWDPYSGNPPPPLPPPRVKSRSKPSEKPPLPPPPTRTGSAVAAAARTPSSSVASPPTLPGRPASGPPRLPARTPSSISSSAIPPPLPSRGASVSSLTLSSSQGAPPPPPIARSTRPTLTHTTELSPPPPPVASPPIAQAFSAPVPVYPQRKVETQSTGQSNNTSFGGRTRFGTEPRIDWTNLSQEDKVAFYGWLDEYFSRSLSITLS